MGRCCCAAASSSLGQDTEAPVGAAAFADGVHLEADVLERLVVQDSTSVKKEGGLQHLGIELVVGIPFELVPLCENDEGVCPVNRLLRCLRKDEPVWVHVHVVVLELCQRVLLFHLRVVDMHECSILQQHVADCDGRG